MNLRAAPVAASRVLAVTAAACLLLAACGTRHRGATFAPATAPRLPVTTAVTTAGASWAVLRTGGKPAGGTFWQLLVRPAPAASWRLVTPPGVADNAGLVLAPGAGGAMTVGFVPSAQLRFTPLATTTDNGAHWSQGLLPAKLAAAPGALAALPGGRLLAITATGAQESGPGGTHWSSLVTTRALAATAAGRACGLTALTAAAAGSSGEPLLAGICSRPGAVGIFRRSATDWQLVPHSGLAGAGRATITVLQINGTNALLTSPGRARVLLGTLTPAASSIRLGSLLRGPGDPLGAAFFSAAGGWGVVAGGIAQYEVSSGGGALNSAPTPLPAAGASAALGAGPGPALAGRLTAFVPGTSQVTIWAQSKAGAWRRTQVILIPAP